MALLTLPLHVSTASAQTIPEVDPCLQDPASCLPPAPEVDPCLEDPASCLPPPPEVDPCLEDPASCLPPPPEVDPCLEDPASCLPPAPSVDECTEDPAGCVEDAVKGDTGPDDEEQEGGDRKDQDAEGSVAPVRGGDPPRRSKGSSRTAGDQPPAAIARAAGPSESILPERPTSLAAIPSPGLLDRIGRGLTDAARRFAFPLAIAALVAAFLIVQGRIDRRDPKLSASPVDGREDVVPFR